MPQTVLILGSTGKFGRNAAAAFSAAGWQVRRFDRARGDLRKAVRGADVVVNGWNPPDYSTWARDLLPLHSAVIDALRGTDATVILPGNVYVFGGHTPAPWSARTPHQATNPLGRLRIEVEAAYARSGVRTVVLRAGDFIDTAASGNWFDKVIVAGLAKGRVTYPGALDRPHAWAFLPDLTRAAVALAEQRADLPRFSDIAFPGYTLTGAQLGAALEAVTGSALRVKTLYWWPIRALGLVLPNMAGLCEMRYLWNTPHSLDGTDFAQLVPGFEPTPVTCALAQGAAHVWPDPNAAPDRPRSAGAAARRDGSARRPQRASFDPATGS